MNKAILNRIRRLELKTGSGDGIRRYLAAISDLHEELPPAERALISPEKQAQIDNAIALLSEEELAVLSGVLAL